MRSEFLNDEIRKIFILLELRARAFQEPPQNIDSRDFARKIFR
jgi:hypothetical protein